MKKGMQMTTRTKKPATAGRGTAAPEPSRAKRAKKPTAKERALERRVRAIAEPLDRFIAKRIHAEPEEFTTEDGWRELIVCGRSVAVRAEAFGDEVILHALSEVMPLPGDRDLVLAVMREALEANGMFPGGTCLSVEGRTLFACTIQFIARPSTKTFETCLEETAWLSGVVAERLVRRYSGTTKRRARGRSSEAATESPTAVVASTVVQEQA